MKYTVKPTARFSRDLKRIERRGYKIDLMNIIVKKLANGEPLGENCHDHPLKGKYEGCRECHITPDWLLIYEIMGNEIFLYLTRTGTHSDLFGR